MTGLATIRHGPTPWNAEGRIQGRTDVALGETGRAAVAGWRVPPEVAGWAWVASPLRRCVETARLLGAEPALEPVLVEMHWGAWEGRKLAELRDRLGPAMVENERRGLDFRPDGGECPRDVQDRIRPWLGAVAAAGEDTVAVTHKGVIRALLGLATGWDMTADEPERLLNAACHLFELDADGRPRVRRLNLPLEAGP
jgi:probable phosphoglycerate mutase